MPLRHLLRILGDEPKESRALTKEEAFRAMTSILSGGESEITVGAFPDSPPLERGNGGRTHRVCLGRAWRCADSMPGDGRIGVRVSTT